MEVRKGGRLYRYLRRRGHPLVALPADVPMDHPRFLKAYAEARADDAPRREAGTVAALVEVALRSDRYRQASAGYRAMLRRHLDDIARTYGRGPARGLRDRHIRADLARAGNATDRRKAWRFACAVGVARGLLSRDPSAGVEAPARKRSEGHPPWTAAEIAAYRARWPMGTVPRAAMELLHWTGARLGDAVRLGPGMVDAGGVLVFRQSKTGGEAFVPWTSPLPAYALPIEGDRAAMHAALAALPGGHMTWLATAHGRSRSDKALGTLIRESARAAGVEKSAHGLRKTRATELADLGATTHQAAAWTGHESLKEVEHYTRRANRRAAVLGTEQDRNSANPPRSMCKPGKKA